MPLLQLDLDRAENPLDIIERIAANNYWSFDRNEDDEISISVAGGWSESSPSPGSPRWRHCMLPAPST